MLQRFFIHVIVANLLRASFLSVDIISHRDSLNVNEKFCEAIGFISQYFASFQLLTITAMMVVDLSQLVFTERQIPVLLHCDQVAYKLSVF